MRFDVWPMPSDREVKRLKLAIESVWNRKV
jgi:hypothetical protein